MFILFNTNFNGGYKCFLGMRHMFFNGILDSYNVKSYLESQVQSRLN